MFSVSVFSSVDSKKKGAEWDMGLVYTLRLCDIGLAQLSVH